MYQSTKLLELGSCAFRQPKAHSHCRYLHGYRLSAKFWFESKGLDENNWVVDFGALKQLKAILREQFDHTTCIDYYDPHVEKFKQLAVDDACDLRLMDGVGIEKFAEWCYMAANKFVSGLTENRCNCIKVEVFEHENNSAIYTKQVEEPFVRYKPLEDITNTKTEVVPVNTETIPVSEDDLTKPPFKVKDEKRPKGVSIKPRKSIGKWVDPDSTWGI